MRVVVSAELVGWLWGVQLAVRHIYGILTEQVCDDVRYDLEAEEFGVSLVGLQIGVLLRKLHAWLSHLGQKDRQEERDDGIIHLEYDFLVCGNTLCDQQECVLEL